MKIDRESETPRTDRRVARTRASLQDAFLSLIPERGYPSITVEDICARADVGRSTFYAHYADKEELRTATIDAHLHSLAHSSVDASDELLFEFSLPMFEHALAARALHDALIADGGDAIHSQVRERIRRSIRDELARRPPQATDIPVEFAVHFVAGAFVSVLSWWLSEDRDISASEADRMFQTLARNGFGPY